jgi:hypothetical protein
VITDQRIGLGLRVKVPRAAVHELTERGFRRPCIQADMRGTQGPQVRSIRSTAQQRGGNTFLQQGQAICASPRPRCGLGGEYSL